MAESKIIRKKSIFTTLWSNPDSTQAFAAQTISLDVSYYDIVVVWFNRTNTGLTLSPFVVNVTSALNSGESQCKTDIVDLAGHFGRRVFKITENGIVFEVGNRYGSSYGSGATEDNTVLVPTLICGFKV